MARKKRTHTKIDYSNGVYFVTFITKHRKRSLGDSHDGVFHPTPPGRLVDKCGPTSRSYLWSTSTHPS
jgi:hypothetical protein